MNSGGIPIVLRDPEAERGIEHPLTFLRFRVQQADRNQTDQASLISTFTPAARSSFISASTVWALGCTMSSNRL